MTPLFPDWDVSESQQRRGEKVELSAFQVSNLRGEKCLTVQVCVKADKMLLKVLKLHFFLLCLLKYSKC